jgi:hypothetical protein
LRIADCGMRNENHQITQHCALRIPYPKFAPFHIRHIPHSAF